jgi:lipopolysaccharide export system permease protein
MLFHSSIRQELARSFIATLVVLITVVMSMMLIRTLSLAARGSVNPSDVILFMSYTVVGQLATIMTLALFVAVTNTLARMYRESEMAVWFACGKGLASFTWPVLRFSWPILLAIAFLALLIWPWATQKTQQLRFQYEQRGDLERVAVGQFQENAAGSRVVFVEGTEFSSGSPADPKLASTPNDGSAVKNLLARNVFVSETSAEKQVITSARTGRIEQQGDDQFVVLSHGQRTELSANGQQVRIMEFEQHSLLAEAKRGKSRAPSVKSLPTSQLLVDRSPAHLAELSWRLGLVLAAINLILLALLLSAVNPRAGRSLGIAFALLAFVVYYNMLGVGFSRIASGGTDFAHLMLGLHGGVFVFTMVWLTLRHNQWSWRHWLPQRKRQIEPVG